MKHFESMEQRIISMYIDLFPPFKPCVNEKASEGSQKQFYDFMESVYRNLFQNPLLLFSKTNGDDFFTRRFNKSSENKNQVYTSMKKCVKTVEEFTLFLYGFARAGELKDGAYSVGKDVKIPKRYLAILQECGIDCTVDNLKLSFKSEKYPGLFECWAWFSSSEDHSAAHFAACMFDKDYPYASEIYSRLSNDEKAFKALESFLVENNYRRMDNRDNKVNLDYFKEYDKKENALKEAWGERTHGGFSAQYDPLMGSPPLYSLRVPYYRKLLEESGKMGGDVKDFVTKKGKKCDNCRYCVQMDKTGKRPLAFVKVDKHNMCTYFPGFMYCWENLDQPLVQNMIAFLTFADEILNDKA